MNVSHRDRSICSGESVCFFCDELDVFNRGVIYGHCILLCVLNQPIKADVGFEGSINLLRLKFSFLNYTYVTVTYYCVSYGIVVSLST